MKKKKQEEFIIALLKAPGLGIVNESYFLQAEYALAQKIHKSELFKTLRVDKSHNDSVIVLWDSKIGQSVAMYISDDGFNFSKIGYFYKIDKKLVTPIFSGFYEASDKGKILAEEVKQIKELIVSYDKEFEKSFY